MVAAVVVTSAPSPWLLPALTFVVLAVVAGVAIWALREMVFAARSLRELADDTRERLNPVLEKADVTVDAVNAELWRIDGIITRFEDASTRVSNASGTISDIVSAPADIVNDVAGRMRRAWKDRKRTTGPDHDEADATTYPSQPADESAAL